MKYNAGLLGMFALALAGNAHALSYSVDLNQVYSGTAPVSQNSPWLRATFEDTENGKVRLTMQALNLTANEFVSTWTFNINPGVAASALTFSLDPNDPHLVVPSSIDHNAAGQNYKAGPEKYFDIQFANPTANTPNRFNAGDTLIYDVVLVGGTLHASDFLFKNQQKLGSSLVDDDWYSAAHVQAIGVAGQSAWIGAKVYYENVPELRTSVPDTGRTLVLFGTASAGLLAFSRYRGREKRVRIS